jgi:predicted regulator of Ras-like GTPase activity (Roadblock/LC7/MglB family)
MAESTDALDAVLELEGAIAVAVIDHGSGLVLAERSAGPFDMELAAAVTTEVVKAKLRAIEHLRLDDRIEDILVTLGSQYHLVRLSEREDLEGVFHYLVLDRSVGNLALARRALATLDAGFSLRVLATISGGLS